jgi:hypothetical protein
VTGGIPGGRISCYTTFMKKGMINRFNSVTINTKYANCAGIPKLRTKAGAICHTSVFICMWIFDPPVRYLPKFFIGGILVFLGMIFVVDWCWETHKRFTKHVRA